MALVLIFSSLTTQHKDMEKNGHSLDSRISLGMSQNDFDNVDKLRAKSTPFRNLKLIVRKKKNDSSRHTPRNEIMEVKSEERKL